jgi:hypothetical protein
MKNFLLLILFIAFGYFASAQCSVTANILQNVLCNGQCNGIAIANATGTPPFSYTWIPSPSTSATASNLCPGPYACMITDSTGCTATSSLVTITQPPALTASAQIINNVSCNGGNNGSAYVTPGGGTPGYTYLWIPSGGTGITLNNASAGCYTVTVTDAHGCVTSSSVCITQPPVLTAVICSITNVTCNGGNDGCAAVCVGGGTPAYSYLWSPPGGNASTMCNVIAGNYTVTVTDSHGCTVTATTTITEPPVLSAYSCGNTNVLCNGESTGCACVTASGGVGSYIYLWSPTGCTLSTCCGLPAGSYTATVTDGNGCSVTATEIITEPDTLSLTITQLSSTSAYATVSGGIPVYTYSWTPGPQTGQTATGLAPGNYTCCVTDVNGCSTCSTVLLTGINELSSSDEIISIYPNPFHSSATLLFKSEAIIQNAELIIYDMLGNEIQKSQIRVHQSEITNLPPGIYLLKIEGIKNRVVKKLIVY